MFPCDFAQRGWHDFDNLFAALQTASIFFWTAGTAGFLLEEEKEWGGEEPPQTKQKPPGKQLTATKEKNKETVGVNNQTNKSTNQGRRG